MQSIEARVLFRPSPAHGYLPEGPRALPDGRFLWITIQSGPAASHGALHRFDPRTGTNTTVELPGRPGFTLPTPDADVVVLGMERAIGTFDLRHRRFDPWVEGIDGDVAGTIVNDGTWCRDGLVFGTKDTEFRTRKAGLWYLRRRDRRLFALRRDQLCSNGKVVRDLPDGRVELFDIDSPTRLVVRYELDPETGVASPPTIAVDLRDRRAVPDGMVLVPGTDDAVVAMFDPEPAASGRALQCSLRTGTVVREFTTPGAAQVTCPLWLPGPRGAQLVLTTASQNLTPERQAQQPDAGCLFVAPAPAGTSASPGRP